MTGISACLGQVLGCLGRAPSMFGRCRVEAFRLRVWADVAEPAFQ